MWHVRKTHFSVRRRKKVEVRKKTLKWIGWLVEANHGGVSHWLDRLMHFSLICIIILIIRINTHSGRETQSSQRERGGTLEKQKAMCRKIMKGQPSTVSDVAVLVSSSSLQPANCYTKACRRISWNLETTMNYIRSASLLRRHPTHFVSSSLFTVQLSVCTYGGGFKGRAKWYSMRECECERGGIKGEREKKRRVRRRRQRR